ncbi:ABC transporter substrate-binding protein [Candidatus Gracilibacteria bacterium]|nr:ABC transporter substrate-binding protein [Candidatus Gracilibacteria bacterium]
MLRFPGSPLRDGLLASICRPGLHLKAGVFMCHLEERPMTCVHRLLPLIVLFTLLLSACGVTPSAQNPTTPAAARAATDEVRSAPTLTVSAPTTVPSAPSTAPGAAATTISDDLGRSVTLSGTPQRIVSLAPSVTEILFAIGADAQVVGVTEFCTFPSEAARLPKVGGFSARTISVEAIVGLQPDLVIAGTASQQPVVEALEALGIPVLVLAPDSLEAVYGSIRQIGAITGHDQSAAAVVADMRTRVATVTAIVATIPAAERPTIFWQVFNDPLMSSGPDTFIGQLIVLAGGTNIFADASEDYPRGAPSWWRNATPTGSSALPTKARLCRRRRSPSGQAGASGTPCVTGGYMR